jgi:energy-converting hydrogenase Eha subunit E
VALNPLHAWLGYASTFAVALPLALSRARRRTRLVASAVGTLLLVAATLSGLLRVEDYQQGARQALFVRSERIGWLFERKQHLAVGAALLAVVSFAAAVARARRRSVRDALDVELAAIEQRALAAVIGFTVFVAIVAVLAARTLRG